MCLAIPAEVISIDDQELATVDMGGVRKDVSVSLLDGVEVGDYVIVHTGFALSKLDPEEAKITLDLFAEMAALVEEADKN
ncbi:MAG: HypC/HybG/HupF family hydrogenase formation chaperone [Rhodospirillales bacterium]|jgi:hydrogenase expression/formation protein HypC|nr:HypC/HybG/HupF family hydrogenase formation chaperone [Rhodospirillales bacterium]